MRSSTVSAQLARAVHVGRQPIHDVAGRLQAYELLFRSAEDATCAQVEDADLATTTTILAAFSEFDAQDLLGGLPGFVNLTRTFLTGGLPVPFEPETVVLEVLETVQLDDEVLTGVRQLHEMGYRIALDDFIYRPEAEPLIEIASIVKIDVLGQTWEEVMTTVEACRRPGLQLLAERVEDAVMMQRCIDTGFTLFQGYHLGRPQTMTTGSIAADHLLAVQLLARLSGPDVAIREIEAIMRTDPGMVLRLLRVANSAANGLRRTVSTITDAVVMIGLKKLRAWMVLITLSESRNQGVDTSVALTRAQTCEQLARRLASPEARRSQPPQVPRADPETAFTLGLLDGIASTLGIPILDMKASLPPLGEDLDAAMAGTQNGLRVVLDAVRYYEEGKLNQLAALGIRTTDVAASYLAALAWTSQTAAAANEV